VKSPVLYLEENIYLNLQDVVRNIQSHPKFLEQYLHFDFTLDKSIKAVSDPRRDSSGRFEFPKQPISKWIGI